MEMQMEMQKGEKEMQILKFLEGHAEAFGFLWRLSVFWVRE